MKKPARSRTAVAPSEPRAKESPFTMTMGPAHRDKLQRMVGYCLMNGVGATSGAILRTLLEQAPEKSADLLGHVQELMAREKEEARERRLQR
jgi:hypothetical protein